VGNSLRSTKQALLFDDIIVGTTVSSTPADIGSTESAFAIQLIWKNGSTPNIVAKLEVSNNKRDWSEYGGSATTINTVSGNVMWDITTGSGCEFIRVTLTVTSGSAEFSGLLNAKERI
jgi:hypothetical protein